MKVLIVSHNPLSSQSNMGKTLRSLLSGFQPEELCQLYIYPTVPSQRHCCGYYRVTDKDVLRALLTGRSPGGPLPLERISPSQGNFEHPGDEKLYRNRKNRSAFRRFARDGMWMLARWYNHNLRDWLEQQRPSCIFVAPGASFFLYNIALKIADRLDLPLVSYLCDEYYFTEKPKAGADRLRFFLLRRKIEALLRRSAHLTVISQEMRQPYAEKFGLPVTVVMTGAGIAPASAARTVAQPRDICYFGNIRENRYRSLAEIAAVLARINADTGADYRLKIYTAEKDKALLAALRRWDTVVLMPFAAGDAFSQALSQAHILLHVESFDPESRRQVRGSISTKLADYLASGVPVLAYGPEELASMAHLARNRCACCVTRPEELYSGVRSFLTDEALRRAVAQQGLRTAAQCHSTALAGQAMRQILEQAAASHRRILQVNSFWHQGSTGAITQLLHRQLRARGYQVTTVYGRGRGERTPDVIRLCPELYGKFQGLRARLGGLPYGGCLLSTWRLCRIIRRQRPDVVHLQCVNGHFVNIYRLAAWLNRKKIPTVVSLHAEFMYTAGCGHAFDCDQWRTGCGRCRQGGRRSWRKMRAAFDGHQAHCVLCPVSPWTAQRVAQGEIFRGFPLQTVGNGVDTACFCHRDTVREENAVLYVTARFSPDRAHPKGGWYLLELARRMPKVTFYIAGPGAPGRPWRHGIAGWASPC